MDPASHCESCRRALSPGGDYIVRIEIFADPATPPVTSEEGDAGKADAISDLIEQMNDMSADDLQDQVHRLFEYRVCASCHKKILANPLGKPRLRRLASN